MIDKEKNRQLEKDLTLAKKTIHDLTTLKNELEQKIALLNNEIDKLYRIIGRGVNR